MKKLLVALPVLLLVACGPIEKNPWPLYELIYATTVSAHNSELKLEESLNEYIQLNQDDSTLRNATMYQVLYDSNMALLVRLEEAITVVSNAEVESGDEDAKSMAIATLKSQQLYQANSIMAVIESGKDGVIDSEEKLGFAVRQESYSTLQSNYNKWKIYRDDYISKLKLPQEELQAMSVKYGKD